MTEINKEFLNEIIDNQNIISVFGDEFNGRKVAILSHPSENPEYEKNYVIVVDSKYFIVGTTYNVEIEVILSITKIKRSEALKYVDEYLKAHNWYIRDFWKAKHNKPSSL